MSQSTQTESIVQPGAPLPFILPDPLPGILTLESKTKVGSYSDVWRGTWICDEGEKVVCIKCLRNTAPATDLSCPNLTPGERFERVCNLRTILVKGMTNQ